MSSKVAFVAAGVCVAVLIATDRSAGLKGSYGTTANYNEMARNFSDELALYDNDKDIENPEVSFVNPKESFEAKTFTRRGLKQNIECKIVQRTSREGKVMDKLSCEDVDDPTTAGLPGQWVYDKTHDTFFSGKVCCAPKNRTNLAKDNFERIKCGAKRWSGSNYSGSMDRIAHLPGFGCMCKKDPDPWVWNKPNKEGSLAPVHFDKHKACDILGNRTVVLIGDSTMQQTSSTLMNSFHPTKCAAQISFNQGDTLVGKRFVQYNRGRHWKDNVLSWTNPPDIVIMAAGAHVHFDKDYMGLITRVMREARELQPEYPNMHFVFKTQQPSNCVHPGVHNSSLLHIKKIHKIKNPQPWKPENPTLAARALNYSYLRYGDSQDSFYDRDLWLMDRVQNKTTEDPSLNFHVLDVRPLYSRTDKHMGSGKHPPKDCLHYCVPGPLDIVGPLFQELLEERIGPA